MNRRQALARARHQLELNGIEDSSLEAEILLRYILKTDRAGFFTYLDKEITPAEYAKLDHFIKRRSAGEPSAYIIGHREFFNLDFKIDRRVLIPRPETEILVEKAIEYSRRYGYSLIADIGTGSGCIAVSLVKNLPGVSVYATDLSLPALEVAAENSVLHGVRDNIIFRCGNLLEPLSQPVDLIIANLPYVKQTEINSLYEPEIALNGGREGLDKILELCRQLPGKLKPGGGLLLEVGEGQSGTVIQTLHKYYSSAVMEITRDLAGIARVIGMRLTSSLAE